MDHYGYGAWVHMPASSFSLRASHIFVFYGNAYIVSFAACFKQMAGVAGEESEKYVHTISSVLAASFAQKLAGRVSMKMLA